MMPNNNRQANMGAGAAGQGPAAGFNQDEAKAKL